MIKRRKIKICHIFIKLKIIFSLIFFSVFTLFKYKDLIINLEIKGDKLWFSDWRTNRTVYGFVKSKSELVICLEGDMNDTNESFKGTESFIGNRRCEWFEVYTSKEELINAQKNSFEKTVEGYKTEITDVDSLLAFPLKNDLTSDYAAETAYKAKAIEFGFNIEHEENIELD